LQLTAACHLGALKKAIASLQTYYEDLSKLGDTAKQNLDYPYQLHFKSLSDSSAHQFNYKSKIEGKLVFEAKLENGDSACVKFVRRYSRDAHEECTRLGCAPTLRGFQCLPGGWFRVMVIMDFLDGKHYCPLDNSYLSEVLYKEMKTLVRLHQAGFIHGDMRTVNTMVRKDESSKFILVDFDWAGKIEEAWYPPNVNTSPGLRRPHGAIDGELILAEHDLEMLKVMFEGLGWEHSIS
jgi:hypothetical protein